MATQTFLVQRPVYTQAKFDELFELDNDEERPLMTVIKGYVRDQMQCSATCMKRELLRHLPFIAIMRHYQWKKWLFPEMVAGFSVGSMHVPQGMAVSLLASVPAVYGLYSALFPALIYFFFGTSRHISVGSSAVICLMIGGVVDRETETLAISNSTNEEDDIKVGIAMSVSLLVGLIQIAMSCLNMGVLATYMSTSFVSGFLTGAAFHITGSQIPSLLGLTINAPTGVFRLPKTYIRIFENIADTNGAEFLIAVVCCTMLIVLKEVINARYKDKLKMPIPAELILVIVATLISHFAKLHERFDVIILGEIPRGIPVPQIPPMTNIGNLVVDALVMAIVGYVLCITMAKMLSMKYRYPLDTNQELLAYGLTNAGGAFLHSFAGSQAPPRTFIHETTGGRTQVGSLFASLFLLIVCLAVGPLFESLPKCTLASIIIVAILPLFKEFANLKTLWLLNKADFVVWMITWGTVVVLDMSIGLGIGLLASLFIFLLQAQITKAQLVGRAPDTELYQPSLTYKKTIQTPGVKIFRFNSPLFFANVDSFQQQLLAETTDSFQNHDTDMDTINCSTQEKRANDPAHNGPLHAGPSDMNTPAKETSVTEKIARPQIIILDCAGISYIDVMGLKMLQQMVRDLTEQDVKLVLADCRGSVIRKLHVIDDKNRIDIYPSVHDAVLATKTTTTTTATAAAAAATPTTTTSGLLADNDGVIYIV